jgi:hypothetical protein
VITDRIRQDAATAAQIIRERGLAKNTLEDDEGRVCLVHAIILAVNLNGGDVRGARKYDLQKAVRDELRVTDEFGLVYWNNQPERTQDEVIELLERVAAT